VKRKVIRHRTRKKYINKNEMIGVGELPNIEGIQVEKKTAK